MTDPRRLVTADRPADIAEADWQNILRGSAFAKALGIVYGDPTGEQADRWLDEAGEIEQQLAREGYVVVPAEALRNLAAKLNP